MEETKYSLKAFKNELFVIPTMNYIPHANSEEGINPERRHLAQVSALVEAIHAVYRESPTDPDVLINHIRTNSHAAHIPKHYQKVIKSCSLCQRLYERLYDNSS